MISLHQSSEQEEGFLKDLIPDLTPMLDILFILLVFFMLTIGQALNSIDLTLPKSATQDVQQRQMDNMVILSLGDQEHSYAINDETFQNVESFKQQILKTVQREPDQKIVIAGDRTVSLERLLNILTFLNDNGIQTANILMQTGEKP